MVCSQEKGPYLLSYKNTASDLKLLEDYDTEEAWKSAVNKRKFLLDRIIKDPPNCQIQKNMMTDKAEHKVNQIQK